MERSQSKPTEAHNLDEVNIIEQVGDTEDSENDWFDFDNVTDEDSDKSFTVVTKKKFKKNKRAKNRKSLISCEVCFMKLNSEKQLKNQHAKKSVDSRPVHVDIMKTQENYMSLNEVPQK